MTVAVMDSKLAKYLVVWLAYKMVVEKAEVMDSSTVEKMVEQLALRSGCGMVVVTVEKKAVLKECLMAAMKAYW